MIALTSSLPTAAEILEIIACVCGNHLDASIVRVFLRPAIVDTTWWHCDMSTDDEFELDYLTEVDFRQLAEFSSICGAVFVANMPADDEADANRSRHLR